MAEEKRFLVIFYKPKDGEWEEIGRVVRQAFSPHHALAQSVYDLLPPDTVVVKAEIKEL